MKTFDPDFIISLINEEYDYTFVAKITYSNGTSLGYTVRDVPVKYDGYVYNPYDFNVDSVNYSSSMAVDQITVRFGNADLAFSAILLSSGDVIGATLEIIFIVMENNQPAADQAFILFSGLISNFDISDEQAVVYVVNYLIFWNKRVLRKALSSCRWSFQGIECGYGDLIKSHTLSNSVWGEGECTITPYLENDFTDAANMSTGWTTFQLSVLTEWATFSMGPVMGGLKLTDNTNASPHFISQDSSVTGSDYCTISVFALKAERDKMALFVMNASGTDYFYGTFNLTTGVANTPADAGSATVTESGIIDCGNGCYYCYVTGKINVAGTNSGRIYLLDNSYNLSYAGGEVNNSGLYVYSPRLIQATTDHLPGLDRSEVQGASILRENSDTNQYHLLSTSAALKEYGNDLFFGIFVRREAITARNLAMKVTIPGDSDNYWVIYDLGNVEINTTFSAGNATLSDYGIIDYGKGWYYCWSKGDLGSNNLTAYFQIFLLDASFNWQYNGTQSYLWLYDVFAKEMNINKRCNKTYEDCTKYGRTNYFGGFRFLPAITEQIVWWGRSPSY